MNTPTYQSISDEDKPPLSELTANGVPVEELFREVLEESAFTVVVLDEGNASVRAGKAKRWRKRKTDTSHIRKTHGIQE